MDLPLESLPHVTSAASRNEARMRIAWPVGRNLIEALPKCTVGEAPALLPRPRSRHLEGELIPTSRIVSPNAFNGMRSLILSWQLRYVTAMPGHCRVDASPKCTGCLRVTAWMTLTELTARKINALQSGPAAAAAGEVPYICSDGQPLLARAARVPDPEHPVEGRPRATLMIFCFVLSGPGPRAGRRPSMGAVLMTLGGMPWQKLP